MRRLFLVWIAGLWAKVQPLDVTAQEIEFPAQSLQIAPLTENGFVELLQVVLEVHEERFDRIQTVVRIERIGHRRWEGETAKRRMAAAGVRRRFGGNTI